jgi:hypothetical protein
MMLKQLKRPLAAMALVLSLACPGLAIAHGAKPAQYGGVVQVASDLQFELVNRDGTVTIYVDDHDRKMPVGGASGTLTVLTDARKVQTRLAAGAGNALVASDKVELAKGSKAVAVIRFADGRSVTARFNVR